MDRAVQTLGHLVPMLLAKMDCHVASSVSFRSLCKPVSSISTATFFFLLHFLVDFADDFMVFKGPNHIAEVLLSMGRVLLIDNLH